MPMLWSSFETHCIRLYTLFLGVGLEQFIVRRTAEGGLARADAKARSGCSRQFRTLNLPTDLVPFVPMLLLAREFVNTNRFGDIYFGAAIKTITESFRFGDQFGYLVRCPTWFYSDRVARTHQISEQIIHFGYLSLLLFR
jgi:hypothetical protein